MPEAACPKPHRQQQCTALRLTQLTRATVSSAAWNGCFMSGRWRCPFASVPAEAYGKFAAFCAQIDAKLAANDSRPALAGDQRDCFDQKFGLNCMQDFYEIAQKLNGSGEEDVDLTWCTVGRKRVNGAWQPSAQSQVHGAAPWAADLRYVGAQDTPLTLADHGVSSTALAPDPEHCLMAVTK